MFQFYQRAKDGKNMKKVLSLLIILAVVLSSTAVFANDIRVPENLPTETLPTQSSSAVKQETPKVTFSDVDANTATGKAIADTRFPKCVFLCIPT